MLKRINLNKYDVVQNQAEADLSIEPFAIDGKRQQRILLRSKLRRTYITDTTNIQWHESVKISPSGTPEEYAQRIDWWFDNASDGYKQQVQRAYHIIPDVAGEVNKARLWLKGAPASKRKSHIADFLQRWLNRTARQYLTMK